MECIIHGVGADIQRCRFIRTKSVDAPKLMWERDRKFLGFCYIDGLHTFEAVKEDIATWWPLIRSGGILAGHDWDIEGVAKAVTEFHGNNPGLNVWVTHEKISPSWYILKE
jgi:hypothetical protein